MKGEVLRDDQWEQVKPFVPSGRKGKRGPRSDGRQFFDALMWMAHSGARWRDLPEKFGPLYEGDRHKPDLGCLPLLCEQRAPRLDRARRGTPVTH
jgi:hypothetical protein